jgi:hypothetical protein
MLVSHVASRGGTSRGGTCVYIARNDTSRTDDGIISNHNTGENNCTTADWIGSEIKSAKWLTWHGKGRKAVSRLRAIGEELEKWREQKQTAGAIDGNTAGLLQCAPVLVNVRSGLTTSEIRRSKL